MLGVEGRRWALTLSVTCWEFSVAIRWSIGSDGNRLEWDAGPKGDLATVDAVRAYIRSGLRLSPMPTVTPLAPDESSPEVWFVAAWMAFVASGVPFTVAGTPHKSRFSRPSGCPTMPKVRV